jgi:outer membrane protein
MNLSRKLFVHKESNMQKQIIAAAVMVACSVTAAWAQTASEGPWLVRARAVHLDMANKDGTTLGLSVNNKTIPEVDVTYFFTPNVAAELVLTVPQKQTVYMGGASIGTFKHLPPSLLLQYHFTGLNGYKPYVGAGLNYTRITRVNLLGGGATLEDHSWGGALQLGMDMPLDKNWSLNFDLKKVYIRSDVFVGAANQGTLKLDPVLVGVGLGYRF